MSDRDQIEPRACVALRLEEIDLLRNLMLDASRGRARGQVPLYEKLMAMRKHLLEQAQETVPALTPTPNTKAAQ